MLTKVLSFKPFPFQTLQKEMMEEVKGSSWVCAALRWLVTLCLQHRRWSLLAASRWACSSAAHHTCGESRVSPIHTRLWSLVAWNERPYFLRPRGAREWTPVGTRSTNIKLYKQQSLSSTYQSQYTSSPLHLSLQSWQTELHFSLEIWTREHNALGYL